LNQLHASGDKQSANDQRPDDPPEEDFVLVFAGHVEVAEDQQKQEQVVGAQRYFDDVAGYEL